MKLPAIQFYPADWRKDPGVQSLDYFDRGVWFEILCLMHESTERGKLMLNGAAMPDEALARVLGLDNQILTKTLTTLLEYGVASRDQETGALICRRMVKDEKLRQVRTEAGKKGGNPALVNQNPTTQVKQIPTTGVNQISTPSSSSSSSSSSSATAIEEKACAGKPRSPSKVKLCDDDHLKDLQSREVYSRLDVRRVYGKMASWCEAHGKQPTRGRLINWLNREDQPIQSVSINGNGSRAPAYVPNDAAEVCTRCFNTNVEHTPKGARPCDHVSPDSS
jgi:hypothetical protein